MDNPCDDDKKGGPVKIVKIDSVFQKYNRTQVSNNVSLEIEQAERIVIFGPSGCGKTTLLRLIAGFIAPDADSISVIR